MNTQDRVREVAIENGWEMTKTLGWLDTFERTPELGPFFTAIAPHIEWTPTEQITVAYASTASRYITDGQLKTPEQQAMLTGKYVGNADRTEGSGRKPKVLGWFTREAVTR